MEIYVAIISTIIAPAILFVLNKIAVRRDKIIEELHKEIQQCRRDTLRLQILQLIHHDRKNRDTILNLLDEYHDLGGNSYITDIAQRWRKSLDKEKK